MTDLPLPPRPATPQVFLHHLPPKPSAPLTQPAKFIVLIMGNTTAAGKHQIAHSVAEALSAPFFHGDQVHDSSAKAATVGSARHPAGKSAAPNKARYQRMWLAKMMRTGLLFPEERRPATEGFTEGGEWNGSWSAVSSRRGSKSSVASEMSSGSTVGVTVGSSKVSSTDGDTATNGSVYGGVPPPTSPSNAVFTTSEEEKRRRENPVLMVMTHPELEPWHKMAIRTSVGEYGIGIVFVPLYEEEVMWVPLYEVDGEDEDLPILKPLDPRTMTGFSVPLTGDWKEDGGGGALDGEMKVSINIHNDVEDKTKAIIEGVRDVLGLKI